MTSLNPIIKPIISPAAARATSAAIRAAAKAAGKSRTVVVAQTKGVNEAVRAGFAAGDSGSVINRNLRAYGRVKGGGRRSPEGSKADNFADEADMQADFTLEHMLRLKSDTSYDPKNGFFATTAMPKLPKGTLKATKTRLAAKKAAAGKGRRR